MKRALFAVALLACSGSAQHPTANAGAATRTAMAGEQLTFDASASTGTITKYTWDFGDGSATVDAETTTHTFATDGDYTVSLTVHGPGGADSTSVLVTVGGACSATAKIVVQTTSPMPGMTVLLGSTGSTGCMGATLTMYEWDFGDGNTASGDASKATVGHIYATKGTYMVKLTVTDENAHVGHSTFSLDVGIVSSGKPTVICQMTANGQTRRPITLTASGSDPSGMQITYSWNFSDSTTAMGSNVMHIFTAPGSYTATVVATTSDNRSSDPCMSSITVIDPPNYTGTWILNPAQSNMAGCVFSVGFPCASLAIFHAMNPDGGLSTMTVTPMGGTYPSGYPLMAAESSPGTFVVMGDADMENPGGQCSLSMLTSHSIHLTFTSATDVTGSWTKSYNGCQSGGCLQCNCSAGGSTSGTFTGFMQ